MSTNMNRRDFPVIIIGAGMTGIGAAYYLRANQIDYAILESKVDLGGVWNTHRWHGARCDSDFIKYSFSFKPFLSAQNLQGREQIQDYLRSVAQEFSILEQIRFNTCVGKAVFSVEQRRWTLFTGSGTFTAQFLINGNGYFSDEPHLPVFRDVDKFKGEIIHTSHLDGSRSFIDKKVVLVGSGATAICCAPALANVSKSLILLQRSPSYIHEIDNQAGRLIRLCQNLHRLGFSFAVKWLRQYLQLRDDLIFVGFRKFPRAARWFFRKHWLDTVGEDALREHFNPSYNPWEQRIAVAIGLKEKLRTGEITIKTGDIDRFTESSIVLVNGETIDCDTCILATGLNLRFFSFDMYVGEKKIALERINFYKGLMVGGIPNYFHPVGSWHSAWTQRLEPLIRMAIRIMEYMEKHGLGTVSVERREVFSLPGIMPNYVRRCLATMPRIHGTSNLPSIDNIFASRFNPEDFKFSKAALNGNPGSHWPGVRAGASG
jgi:monooxygenase